tara:strand:+ start:1387 stop:2331 length:945 start_codon:yes stop_codon:yes gene_type:complete
MGQIEINHTGSGGTVVLSSDGTDLLLGGSAVGGGADLYAANESSPAAQPSATGANAVAIGDSAVATAHDGVGLGFKASSHGEKSFAVQTNRNDNAYGATAYASVAIMPYAKSTASGSMAVGQQSVASGAYSYSFGNIATATSTSAYSLGHGTLSSAENAYSYGHYSIASVRGSHMKSSGHFAAAGDAMGGTFLLRCDTTDATQTTLTANNGSIGSTVAIVAASDTSVAFHGTVVAQQNGAASYAAWEIKGLLVNDGGTTSLPSSALTVLSNSSSWGLALVANNTTNTLDIKFTGEASHNIRVVSHLSTSQVTYA